LITIGAPFAQIGFGRRQRVEAFIGGGRDAVVAAQVLGEALGAFEPRGILARAEGFDAGGFEIIDDAGAERGFRPDHDEIDGLVAAIRDHAGVVGDIKRHAGRFAGDAGIAGGAIELLGQRARRDLPGQRMFAAAGAKNEDVHARMFIGSPTAADVGLAAGRAKDKGRGACFGPCFHGDYWPGRCFPPHCGVI
jgi:hypothetical protein